MTRITDFDSFLAAARAQPEPQRLRFVFVKAVLPADADAAETARYEAGRGGGLLPVTYVDKHPDEVAGFEALREESRRHADDWQILLAGARPRTRTWTGRSTRSSATSMQAAICPGCWPSTVTAIRCASPAGPEPRGTRPGPVLTQINMHARRLANNAGSTARRCHAIMIPGPAEGTHRRPGTATAEGNRWNTCRKDRAVTRSPGYAP